MLAAFPPYREESGTYRALLKSALEDGLNPAVEDDRGRNSIFLLCEAMASVPSDQSPDSSRLISLLIEQGNNMNPYFGIGGSDKTGRTIFDIEESTSNSCLANSRMILMQGNARAKDIANANNMQIRSSNGAPRMNSVVSRSSSYDWDAAEYYSNNQNITRIPSGVIASTIASNGTRFYNGGVNGKSRSVDNHVHNNHSQTGRSKSQKSNDYFDDIDDDDDYRSEFNRNEGISTRSAPASSSTAVPVYSPIAVMRRK